MDYDTTRTRGSYEQILASFAAHEADILVGTQMIVKGHDFPDVTLVGVIAADLSLNEADYPLRGEDLPASHPGGGTFRKREEDRRSGDPDLSSRSLQYTGGGASGL